MFVTYLLEGEVFVSSVNNCKGTLLLFEQFAELNLLVRRSLNYPICSSQTVKPFLNYKYYFILLD